MCACVEGQRTHQMRLKTSAFGSMIVTVPIDISIALANDDAAGSSATSLPNLLSATRGRPPRTGYCWEGEAYACWLLAYAHTQYGISSHESSSPAM